MSKIRVAVTQVKRDLPLIIRFTILAFGLVSSTIASSGQYVLTSGWPTGIHDGMFYMDDSQEEDCVSLSNEVIKINAIKDQLFCKFLDGSGISGENLVTWLTPSLNEAARLANTLLDGYVDKEELDKYRERIQSGTVKLSIAQLTIYNPYAPSSPFREDEDMVSVSLVKYSSGDCSDITEVKTVRSKPRVRYGISFKDDFSDLRKIDGIGSTEEEFIWDNQLYFISFSYRAKYDDPFFSLHEYQQVINISNLSTGLSSDKIMFTRVCRFLYWKDGQEIVE